MNMPLRESAAGALDVHTCVSFPITRSVAVQSLPQVAVRRVAREYQVLANCFLNKGFTADRLLVVASLRVSIGVGSRVSRSRK